MEELLGTQGSMEERLRSKGIAQGPHLCREKGICVHEAAGSSIEREPTGSGRRVPGLLAGCATAALPQTRRNSGNRPAGNRGLGPARSEECDRRRAEECVIVPQLGYA